MDKNRNDQRWQNQDRDSRDGRSSKRYILFIAAFILFAAGSLFVSSRSHAKVAPEPPLLHRDETPITNSIPLLGEIYRTEQPILPTKTVQPSATAAPEPKSDLSTPIQKPTTESAPANLPVHSPTPTLPTPAPWSGSSRINILLLGLDYGEWDSPEREGPPRSDTMILISIDTEAKSAGILSIPRDLWVDIPGMIRPNKINAAYRFGEHYQLPGGGPGLAMRTVEQLLGIPVDFYLEMDFYAFERAIEEIGGIDVEVQEEIKVHRLAPKGSVILEPGKHTLDGPTALAYARNRSTSGGDFDRSQRQQQVMMGIRDKVLKLDTLPRLLYKAPNLYREVRSGIKTNLSLNKMIQLAWLSQSIPPENIQKGTIGPGEVLYDMSEDGQSILLPVPFRIQQLVNQTLSMPDSNPDLAQRMQAEEASLYIVNASGKEGLDDLTAVYLESKGAIVGRTANTGEIIPTTIIIDYSGKPYTIQYLARLMSIPLSEIRTDYDPSNRDDVLVILGSDWERKANLKP